MRLRTRSRRLSGAAKLQASSEMPFVGCAEFRTGPRGRPSSPRVQPAGTRTAPEVEPSGLARLPMPGQDQSVAIKEPFAEG